MNELPQLQPVSRLGLSTITRAWRDEEYKAGRPSGQLDFYRAHAICIPCQDTGISAAPVEWAGGDPRFKPCQVCPGSGQFKVL